MRAACSSDYATRIAAMGYAVPGTVMGLGILIPFAAFDNSVDSFMRVEFRHLDRAIAFRDDRRSHLRLCRAVPGDSAGIARKRTCTG